MRLFTKTVFAIVPALILASGTAQAATESWRQGCVRPEHGSSPASKAEAAPAKKSAAKLKAKKPASVASENAVAKPKKAKKIAKAQDADEATVKVKKAKKIAKSQDDDELRRSQRRKPRLLPRKIPAAIPAAKSYQSGVASWYGGYFHGRTTANGEKYDMWAMTAAHKTLPFGTRVKVTNTSNGDSTIVRINDRGPFVAGRLSIFPKPPPTTSAWADLRK